MIAMPTITALKSMTGWRTNIIASVIACAACLAHAAEPRLSVEELAVRADAGDRGAMRALADTYYVGRNGIEQDYPKAAEWFRRLARLGDPNAQTSLGLMYARGYGVEKNMAEAHRWWNFAAVQNDPGAQYNLGLTYVQGAGVAVDRVSAARWFREAAMRGHVHAQYNLGLLLHEGRGIERDPQDAYYWVRVAALQGDERARASMAVVGAELQDTVREEIDARADAWLKQQRKTPS